MKTPPPPPRTKNTIFLIATSLEIGLEDGLMDLLWELTDHEDKAPPFSDDYDLQRERFEIVLTDVVRTSDLYDRAFLLLLRLLRVLNNPEDRLWTSGYPHPIQFPQ